MKRIYKIILTIVFSCLLVAYGIYWAFFDLQRINGQEVLQEVPSPSGDDTIIVYLNNGGATTSYAILCTVKDNQTGRERNIYWQDHRDDANVQWVDDDTVIINNVELDVWKDSYDFRNVGDRATFDSMLFDKDIIGFTMEKSSRNENTLKCVGNKYECFKLYMFIYHGNMLNERLKKGKVMLHVNKITISY